MLIKQLTPRFGVNYKPGYVGFSFDATSPVSAGIAYFSRWERMNAIKVSHTFLVASIDTVVEAHIGSGVTEAPIAPYFTTPGLMVCFRKPRYYNATMGELIVGSARTRIGRGYDRSLILGHAIANSLFGRFIDRFMHGEFARSMTRRFDNEGRDICVETVVEALDERPILRNLGCLAKPPHAITPQELFEDNAVFMPWEGQVTA